MNILQVLLIFLLANYPYIRSTTLSRKMGRGVLNYLRRNRKVGVGVNAHHLMPPPPAQLLQPPARTGKQIQMGNAIPISTETPRYLTNPIGWFNSLGSSSVSHVPRAPHDFSTDPYRGTFPDSPLPLSFASSMQFREKKVLPLSSSNIQSNLAPALKRETCNPCNKIPWTPVGYNFFHLRKDSSDDLNAEFPSTILSNTYDSYLSQQEKFSLNFRHVDPQEAKVSDLPDLISRLKVPPLIDPNLAPIDPFSKREPPQSATGYSARNVEPEIQFHHQHGNPSAAGQMFNYGDLTTSGSAVNPNRVSVTLPGHEMSFNEGIQEKRPVSRTTLNNGDSVSEISNKEEYYRPSIEKVAFGSSSNYSGTSYLNSFVKLAEANPSKEDFADTVASHSSIEPLNDIYHVSSILDSGFESIIDDTRQDLNASENISSFNSSSTATLPAYDLNHQQYAGNIGEISDSRTASQRDVTESDERQKIDTETLSPAINNVIEVVSFHPEGRNMSDDSSINDIRIENQHAPTRERNMNQKPDTPRVIQSDPQTAFHVPSSTFPEGMKLSSKELSRSNGNTDRFGKGRKVIAADDNGTSRREQNTKHSTQVQVIIPYTSDFSPIPFRQSQWNWKFENSLKSATPKYGSNLTDTKDGDYYGSNSTPNSVSRIFASSELDKNDNPNAADILRTKLSNISDLRLVNIPAKLNSSIDLKRLQKNIDNWTIEEYSRTTTTSSTLVPSSMRFYLLPSKKIPNEFLRKTDVRDNAGSANTVSDKDIEKYFSNGSDAADVVSKGWRVNQSEINKLQEIDVDDSKVAFDSEVTAAGSVPTWMEIGASTVSPSEELAYVVSPETRISIRNSEANIEEKEPGEGNSSNSQRPYKMNGSANEQSYGKFEAIERIYQVLPQAVNNLALASTGKEGLPLWGIMEHDEFASSNFRDWDTDAVAVAVDRPVLHTGF